MVAIRGPISISNTGANPEIGGELLGMTTNIERPVGVDLVDIEEFIQAGLVPVEAVTGGVRVDAISGEVQIPASEETLLDVRGDATTGWLDNHRDKKFARAMRSLNSKREPGVDRAEVADVLL